MPPTHAPFRLAGVISSRVRESRLVETRVDHYLVERGPDGGLSKRAGRKDDGLPAVLLLIGSFHNVDIGRGRILLRRCVPGE